MTVRKINQKDVVGVECRHVVYTQSKAEGSKDDMLFVKEAVHLSNGEIVPNVRQVFNFKRDFYVTKDGFRKHKDKKLFESIDRVHRIETTQRMLSVNVAKALRRRWVPDMRILGESQYLYGTDVPSTTIYKEKYKERWPDVVSLNAVAVCDLETDVIYTNGQDIISGSITFREHAVIVINKSFLAATGSNAKALQDKFEYYLSTSKETKFQMMNLVPNGLPSSVLVNHSNLIIKIISSEKYEGRAADGYADYCKLAASKNLPPLELGYFVALFNWLEKDSSKDIRAEIVKDVVNLRSVKLEILFADDPGDLIVKLIAKAHEWRPDFLAFWNIDFDVPKMEETLNRYGIDPADVFSDPSVAPEFRYFKYNEGTRIKATEAGRVMPLSPAEQWHTVTCPASFFMIDAMCVYQKIRIGKGKMSFSLDATLERHLGVRKLKFKEADGLEKLAWHQFMQHNYKLEYLVYNLFDCFGVELLDEMNMDLASTVSLLCRSSDYAKFNSQPRRTCDRLHFFGLKEKVVIASTPKTMLSELDELVVTTEDWIVTLPAHQIVPSDYHPLVEFPNLLSQVYLHVGDIDVAAAYPNGQDILNISHETTFREVSIIEGLDIHARRKIGINITGGRTNALEFCRDVYQTPTLETMLGAYLEARAVQEAA